MNIDNNELLNKRIKYLENKLESLQLEINKLTNINSQVEELIGKLKNLMAKIKEVQDCLKKEIPKEISDYQAREKEYYDNLY